MKKNELVVANTKAVATVEAKQLPATKVNAKKENKVLDLGSVKQLFVECGITPKYTDSTNYVGCGTRANTFSVNVKKTKYNIYLGDEEFAQLEGKVKTSTMIKGGNKVDKTRPNYIECKDTAELKTMLSIILKNNAKIALAK